MTRHALVDRFLGLALDADAASVLIEFAFTTMQITRLDARIALRTPDATTARPARRIEMRSPEAQAWRATPIGASVKVVATATMSMSPEP